MTAERDELVLPVLLDDDPVGSDLFKDEPTQEALADPDHVHVSSNFKDGQARVPSLCNHDPFENEHRHLKRTRWIERIHRTHVDRRVWT